MQIKLHFYFSPNLQLSGKTVRIIADTFELIVIYIHY